MRMWFAIHVTRVPGGSGRLCAAWGWNPNLYVCNAYNTRKGTKGRQNWIQGLTVRFHETLFLLMVVGKDSRTYTATLERGKTHALDVAELRRQPCRL